MCHMREIVHLVDDDRLAVPWLAATSSAGERVVFVRESDEPLLGQFCAAGPAKCPVHAALLRQSRTVREMQKEPLGRNRGASVLGLMVRI